MAYYMDDADDSPSANYMDLTDENIDSIINENFQYICDNLRVYDLITGSHSFVRIIPNALMEELRIKDPELKIKHAEKFLIYYLKSRDPGKGKVLKDALLKPEHDLVRKVFSSRASELDKEAHSNERTLLDLHIRQIVDTIDCDAMWLAECLQRNLITANDFQEIQANRRNNGPGRGVVLLVECVKRAKDGYAKFMKLLWKMDRVSLVKEIDPEKYEKFKAMDRDNDCDGGFNEMVLADSCQSDETMLKKPYFSKNIPTEEMNNLDGPIASRTRSKTKAIGFQSPRYNDNASCSVNEQFSRTDMSPQMMNPKTVDKPANVTSTKYDKSSVSPGAYNHSNSSEDEDHNASKDKKSRKFKTKSFGFQSKQTILLEVSISDTSTRNGNCDKFQYEQSPAEKRQEIQKPRGDLKEIQFRAGNEGYEEAQSEHTYVKKRLEEPKPREDLRAIQQKTCTKPSEEVQSKHIPQEKRQEKDLKTTQFSHKHVEKVQSAQSPQEKRKENVQPQTGYPRPVDLQFELTALKNRKDKPKPPEDWKTKQLKCGEEPREDVKSTQTTAKEVKNKRNPREESEKVPTPSANARQLYEELPSTGSSHGLRSFRCSHCNAAFGTDEKRQQHKCSTSVSLPPKPLKPLRCRCGKAFKDAETLTKHKASCDSGISRANSEPSDLRRQTYKCDKCGSKFLDKEKLEKHKRTQH